MSKKRINTNVPFRPVSASLFDTNKNTDWLDERLAHEKQLRFYKVVSFWFALIICFLLYGAFFLELYRLHNSPLAQVNFISHTHLLSLLIVLLVIPSAILWGIVRAVFRLSESVNNNEVLKTLASIHPLS